MLNRRAEVTVAIHAGAPTSSPEAALELDVGNGLPVAYSGLRRLIRALQTWVPDIAARARARHAPEWSYLFAEDALPATDLGELADAPNQRRLFRESEQTYRVLNFGARLLVEGLAALGRPLVLRNTGSCDLVSLRGLMHAVEYGRLAGVGGALHLCDWQARGLQRSTRVRALRDDHGARLVERMGAVASCALDGSGAGARSAHVEPTLEGAYLARTLDAGGGRESRLASAVLALRACFFSTNYEGAILAAETGLELLADGATRVDEAALRSSWDEQDDPRFDVPMAELDRFQLMGPAQLRALFRLHLGVVQVFSGRLDEGLDSFAAGLAEPRLLPGTRADLHMYRALTLTKRLGRIGDARHELEAGLAALHGEPRQTAALHEAWLRNLYALTYVQEKQLDRARQQEELALACIDGLPGPSATHLKTNVISNFSVLAEAQGDYARAIQIWRIFEPLNRTLKSDNADKVHAYRLGVLCHLQGDRQGAIASFETAWAKAEASGDLFNGETIAATLARVHLEGDAEAAQRWYELAADRALAAGDCLHRARDLAGLTLARGQRDFTSARAALACNSTYRLDAAPLAIALAGGGDVAAVQRALPLPRSKMTRPFDLVNV